MSCIIITWHCRDNFLVMCDTKNGITIADALRYLRSFVIKSLEPRYKYLVHVFVKSISFWIKYEMNTCYKLVIEIFC
jgi:hypothetical protein